MKISVSAKQATITERETLTTGSRGIIIAVEFSPEWDELAKTAQFYDGEHLIPVIMMSDFVLVPWEMTSVEGSKPAVVFIGKQDGEVKASVECSLGTVWYGIRDGLYPPEPPTPDWIEQIETAIRENREGVSRNAEAIEGKIPAAEKGQSNGVATLDEDGKVPAAQLPTSSEGKQEVFTAVISNEVGRLVCDMTAKEIIDASRNGMVKATYTDDTSGETRTYQYAKQTDDSRAVFEKPGYIEDGVTHQSLIYVDYAGNVTVETREPAAVTVYATCNAEAAPVQAVPTTWYVSKDMPKPSGNVGMMVDVFWKNGRADGIGYDISLVWGEEGGSDNEVIVPTASTTDPLTGEYSIPAEGTIRYQLIEQSGRKRWRYVSGRLIGKSFSTDTAASVADKVVPGMAIGYLPGMEIYVQLDKGNTASIMRLVPDSGQALPVYGNGQGKSTGEIPAGYICHLKNAGDHWQIINAIVKSEKDSFLAKITGASIGQYIRVKSIDSEGRPTAFEAVNL